MNPDYGRVVDILDGFDFAAKSCTGLRCGGVSKEFEGELFVVVRVVFGDEVDVSLSATSQSFTGQFPRDMRGDFDIEFGEMGGGVE